ncbi:MAG: DMT family transporter [Alphaproteobacteria bacterium]
MESDASQPGVRAVGPVAVAHEPALARAMLLMAGAVSLYPISDAIAKYLALTYHPIQVTWARYVFQSVMLAAVLGGPRAMRWFRTAHLKLQLARAALAVLSTVCFVSSLRLIEVVDAIAIIFIGPLLMVAFSVPLLGERVGVHRWSAVIVGFIGMLIVFRPGFGMAVGGALLALVSAVFNTLMQIITRKVVRTDPPITTLLYLVAGGGAFISLVVPFYWTPPQGTAWMLMILAGLIGGIAHFGVIKAIQLAPLSALAPFSYTQIASATIVSFVVSHYLPDGISVLGVLIVIGSGLYVFHRERRLAARASAPQ